MDINIPLLCVDFEKNLLKVTRSYGFLKKVENNVWKLSILGTSKLSTLII